MDLGASPAPCPLTWPAPLSAQTQLLLASCVGGEQAMAADAVVDEAALGSLSLTEAAVSVRFSVQFDSTYGQRVILSGPAAALGNYDPAKAVALDYQHPGRCPLVVGGRRAGPPPRRGAAVADNRKKQTKKTRAFQRRRRSVAQRLNQTIEGIWSRVSQVCHIKVLYCTVYMYGSFTYAACTLLAVQYPSHLRPPIFQRLLR